MSYGNIFWGNSHLGKNIFKMQQRIIRIITNNGKRDSYQHLYEGRTESREQQFFVK
jgi:hypothetical protein